MVILSNIDNEGYKKVLVMVVFSNIDNEDYR
jgi:hypothetical protein